MGGQWHNIYASSCLSYHKESSPVRTTRLEEAKASTSHEYKKTAGPYKFHQETNRRKYLTEQHVLVDVGRQLKLELAVSVVEVFHVERWLDCGGEPLQLLELAGHPGQQLGQDGQVGRAPGQLARTQAGPQAAGQPEPEDRYSACTREPPVHQLAAQHRAYLATPLAAVSLTPKPFPLLGMGWIPCCRAGPPYRSVCVFSWKIEEKVVCEKTQCWRDWL